MLLIFMVLRSEIRKRSFLEQLIGMMDMGDPRVDLITLNLQGDRCELCGEEIEGMAYIFRWEEQRNNTSYVKIADAENLAL